MRMILSAYWKNMLKELLTDIKKAGEPWTQKQRKILKVIGIIILAIVLILAVYIIYLYASYYRIEDNQELQVETISDNTSLGDAITTGEKYSALTYNIGFGAYTPDFSFFMDGEKSSWAKSKDSVKETIKGAGG